MPRPGLPRRCYVAGMEENGPPRGLEREATDQSLQEERLKTDEELAKRRSDIDGTADAIIASARSRADRILKKARAKADQMLSLLEDGPRERGAIDAERSREDEVTREERTTADDTLARERSARRRAMAALLILERDQTDDHLLLERDRADQSIASRDDFLGMVSHDLRNLLGGMAMSAVSLLNIPADGETRSAISANAQRIQRYTARMNRLVGDLLDVVSIEAGRLALIPQQQNAADLVRETLDAFNGVAGAKNISIRTEVRAGTLLAQYDQERILQVLANLVGNAIKFTPKGGRIDIIVEPVDHDVRFGVIDSGPGIPEQNVGVIFERFWRVPKRERSGLGLGLYISKCIVEAHGGKIWVESPPEPGSAFYFTLPGSGSVDDPVAVAR
jgi:signal transduction histidine kinase